MTTSNSSIVNNNNRSVSVSSGTNNDSSSSSSGNGHTTTVTSCVNTVASISAAQNMIAENESSLRSINTSTATMQAGSHHSIVSTSSSFTTNHLKQIRGDNIKVKQFHMQRHGSLKVSKKEIVEWRMKQRLKTVHVALIICLNIGVDPPDVIKIHPCAKLESWKDPFSCPQQKALESIGIALKDQYGRWQPRARYKLCLDPTVEEVKKSCSQLRRSAKRERVLFHYNGHGVPKPTPNGEIWVFNKDYTQYIPLSIFDLIDWMDSPSIYVFDCSSAGLILNTFSQLMHQKEIEDSGKGSGKYFKENIILASCGANENLPINPIFPADLFTSCLTTPIKVALHWYFHNNRLVDNLTIEMIESIPGKESDRRTPLGELNWIFTAVTDTIAWSVLPRDLFHKLFRQDLLVASLFRNFLLADRIMRTANCTPLSYPRLPSTHNHPMWQSWDLALDMCMVQLPKMTQDQNYEYQYSSFFSSQLIDFEVWLDFGYRKQSNPTQLPILLQVLLSQVHRLKALTLLARFLDMGPWAVNLALSVGIFPYVLKLLQSNSVELRHILVFIWSKILALDRSCQVDLVKDNGHIYFINIIATRSNEKKLRASACFVLGIICDKFRTGQMACFFYKNMLSYCTSQLNEDDAHLRKWTCFMIAKMLEGFDEAQEKAIEISIHEKLIPLLSDDVPEVRAAAVYALQCFVGCEVPKPELKVSGEISIGTSLYKVISDGSPVVRMELIHALFTFINSYGDHVSPSLLISIFDDDKVSSTKPITQSRSSTTISTDVENETSKTTNVYKDLKDRELGKRSYFVLDLCRVILILSRDPSIEVAQSAQRVINHIKQVYLKIPAAIETAQNDTKFSPFSRSKHSKTRSQSPAANRLNLPQSASNLFKRSSSEPNFALLSNSSDNDNDVDNSQNSCLESSYYEISKETFSKPQMIENKRDDTEFLSPQLARKQRRMDQLVKEALSMYKLAGKRKLEEQIGFFGNEADIVSEMKFHPSEPLLIVADEYDGISVWNWINGKKINRFKCESKLKGRITDFHIVNEQSLTNSLLLVSSASGNICFYKDYESKEKLVTAIRAVPEAVPSGQGPGIITQYQAHHGLVYVSGDTEHVKIWDLEKELCVQSIPTDVEACVTSMTCDTVGGGYTFAAGCSNGTVLIFDRRVNPKSHQIVARMKEHKNWVVNVHMQKVNNTQIISGSTSGDIKFWDTRIDTSTRTFDIHKGNMTALAIHDYAPVLASGSNNQFIKVFNTAGETLSMIYYHDGFLGQRIGPVSSLAFHPYKMCLAAGSTDSIISIYSGDSNFIQKMKKR